jgi:hypothetical protein
MPLLSDVSGTVAEAYGVATTDDRYLTNRAVVVIDRDGFVTYTWEARDIEDRPEIEAVQAAFDAIADADLAKTEYSRGHESFAAGRVAFLDGVAAHKQREWVPANSHLQQARSNLSEADEHLDRARRFSGRESMSASIERSKRVVEELRTAVGFLDDAVTAYAAGETERADRFREECARVLDTLQDLGAPPDPENLLSAPAEMGAGDGDVFDVDLTLAEPGATGGESRGEPATDLSDEIEGDEPQGSTDGAVSASSEEGGAAFEESPEPNIDESDLEELTEEIETQAVQEEDAED